MKLRTSQIIVATLCVVGVGIEIFSRSNLNIAMVAMVEQDETNELLSYLESKMSKCSYGPSEPLGDFIPSPGPKYDWSPSLQGILLGAFNYGIMITHIPGGRLAEVFGGKWLIFLAMAISSLVNVLTPLMAQFSYVLIGSRIVLGMAQGLVMPSCYAILVAWLPRDKAIALFPILGVGGNVGSILTSFLTGFLCEQHFLDGWPAAFYFAATLIVVWLFLWVTLVSNRPKKTALVEHDKIQRACSKSVENAKNNNQKDEYSSLLASHASGDVLDSVPWRRMLSSPSVWGIVVCKFTLAWASTTIATKLPAYMQEVLRLPVSLNGLVTALVYCPLCISLASGGFLANYIIKKQWLSRTNTRKVFQTMSSLGSAICLLLVPFTGCSRLAAFILLGTSKFFLGMLSGGDVPIVAEMTKNFPATLFALTNMVSFVAGIITPWLSGAILESAPPFQRRHYWDIIFYMTAGVEIFGLIVFLLLASSERQDWDRSSKRPRGETVRQQPLTEEL